MQTQNELNKIKEAGKAMAEEQFPLYLKKQDELREKYKEILNTDVKTDKEKEEEKQKMESMTKEKLETYLRDQTNRKHVRKMTKTQRESEIANIMRRLYFGLDDLKVPSAFESLVSTGNDTLDSINQYNIVLAMQTNLKQDHPEIFSF